MSLTTAQKHDLIIAFNNEREESYGDYQKGKTMRKEEEEKSGTKIFNYLTPFSSVTQPYLDMNSSFAKP